MASQNSGDLIIALRPRQNGRRFADDTFKRMFLNEDVRISIKISLKFVPKGPINNIPALVQIMAWHRSGDKPLSEPMMVSLLTHICVTRPQWVICVTACWDHTTAHWKKCQRHHDCNNVIIRWKVVIWWNYPYRNRCLYCIPLTGGMSWSEKMSVLMVCINKLYLIAAVQCIAPPIITNGTVLPHSSPYFYLRMIHYTCQAEHRFIDGFITRNISCNEFGHWDEPDVSCRSEFEIKWSIW